MRKSKTGNQRNGQKKKDKRTTIYEPQALEYRINYQLRDKYRQDGMLLHI